MSHAEELASALPAWEYADNRLSRHITTPDADATLLAQSLRTAASEAGRELDIVDVSDGVVVALALEGDLSGSDLELVGRLEAILAHGLDR